MKSIRLLLALLAAALLAPSAQAQLFRAYVSSAGLDTNPCTLTQPCRLLPAALTAVANGGEIWMLDSANYNTGTVNVTKSVTILAVPGVVGSVVATGGGDGIYINAGGISVTLRNLVIVHLTSSVSGVYFVLGDSLHIEDCEFSNMGAYGLLAIASNATVTVRGSTFRGNATGLRLNGVSALDRVRIVGNTLAGIVATDGASLKVSDSLLADNVYNVQVSAQGFSPARVAIVRSILTGGFYGLYTFTAAAAGVVEASISDSNLTNHTTAAIHAQNFSGGTLNVSADTNWIAHSGTGFGFGSGTPTIYSRGNNTLRFNGTDVSGGSLTPFSTQ